MISSWQAKAIKIGYQTATSTQGMMITSSLFNFMLTHRVVFNDGNWRWTARQQNYSLVKRPQIQMSSQFWPNFPQSSPLKNNKQIAVRNWTNNPPDHCSLQRCSSGHLIWRWNSKDLGFFQSRMCVDLHWPHPCRVGLLMALVWGLLSLLFYG